MAETEIARHDETRRPTASPWTLSGTCDWGECDHQSVAWRWDPEHGWLPVCNQHRSHHPADY